jgi:tRNA threonylcarbamoyladenosine biosynthesis protein TsaB
MISLFIDTSNFRLIIAVVDELSNNIISYYNEKLSGDLSVKVFDVIKTCIDQANIKPKDIEKIYCVTGPGSFTGVRIGVTISKTFAWSLNKKVIPISSLEVLASTKADKNIIVGAIDARRDYVYAGVYDAELNIKYPDKYILIEELKKLLVEEDYYVVTDDEINGFENKLNSNIDVLKIINKHKNDMPVNPHKLNPNYLKITEAEANLKKKND